MFLATYGFEPDHEYDGRLDNGGELIELIDETGQRRDTVTYDDHPDCPVKPDGLGPSLELIDPDQDNDTPRNWHASVSAFRHTAGAVNSVDADGLPPWITDVNHTIEPDPTVEVAVAARVEDASTVTLHYVIAFGEETSTPMLDDGAHGDGDADDGVYGGSIAGQAARTLIRFRIEAEGPTGVMWHPRDDDSILFDGTVVGDSDRITEIPLVQWFMRPEDFAAAIDHRRTDQTEPAVAYFDGALYDNIRVRRRRVHRAAQPFRLGFGRRVPLATSRHRPESARRIGDLAPRVHAGGAR